MLDAIISGRNGAVPHDELQSSFRLVKKRGEPSASVATASRTHDNSRHSMRKKPLISVALMVVIAFCPIPAWAAPGKTSRLTVEMTSRNEMLMKNCRVLIDMGTKPRTKQQIATLDREAWLNATECGAYLQGFADKTLAEEAMHKETCLVGHSWDRLTLAKIYVGWMDKKIIADPEYLDRPITHTIRHALADAFPCS